MSRLLLAVLMVALSCQTARSGDKQMMKAVVAHEYGAPTILKLENVPRPEPNEDEALVRMIASAVNPADPLTLSGKYAREFGTHLPLIPGYDIAGVVVKTGKNITRLKIGDAVYGYPTFGGGWAEYVTVKEWEVAAKPKSLSFTEAAAVPMGALTAWQALVDVAKLQPGQRILIHGGSGGVGSFAVQIAKAHGSYVLATASRANQDLLKQLGADLPIDYTKTRFEDVAKDVDAVLDPIGKDNLARSYGVVKKGGIVMCLVASPDRAELMKRGIHGAFISVHPDAADLAGIAGLIDAGKIKPIVTQVLPFTEANAIAAQQQAATHHTRGKVVLRIADETVAAGSTSSTASPRAQVTVENWDKGGALSHWVYTHVSEVFPVAVIERDGTIVDLPTELKPEIGALKVNDPGAPEQTLDQFVNNGAVDGCIVLHGGKIVYEKYPTIRPNDVHIMMSITKAVVLTALAILEDQGKIDLEKPVEQYLPELEGSDWAGTRLRDLVDMRSGMQGVEDSNDAYRNPKHKEFQVEATLGWLPRTSPETPDAARHGDLFGMLRTIKRERKAGEKWAYTSSNTVVIGEIVSRVAGKSLAEVISELIWSKIGAEHDAFITVNERGFPMSGAGMAATLRDVARFGLASTRHPPLGQSNIVSDAIIQRFFGGRPGTSASPARTGAKPDEHGMLPLTYEWDMISDKGELAKGGWAGQLLYINREKDVVVAWFGTNQTANPKLEALPCRIIARTFF